MARKKAKTLEQQKAEAALKQAVANAPYHPFVVSCERFFKDKSFLTQKQIDGLSKFAARDGSCGDYEQDDWDGYESMNWSYADIHDWDRD